MLLLFAHDGVFGYLVGRGVGQDFARFLLQFLQLVEEGIPLIVGHQLALAIIINVRSLVQLIDQASHHIHFILHKKSFVEC